MEKELDAKRFRFWQGTLVPERVIKGSSFYPKPEGT
jgi:hypothetical protein